MAAGSSGGASEGGGDQEEVAVAANHNDDPHIVLKKSSSRDYSRVMCETLTYSSGGHGQPQRGLSTKAMNGSGMMMMERQGSLRSGGTSTRYAAAAAPSKRSYFGHHFLGCFPGSRSSKTRSSLGLIPKLVLADHPGHGAAAVAEMMMVASGGGGGGGGGGSGGGGSMRCGSTKGGPTFSRVPADSARGSYSEPTSPQVTCIGQVKVRASSSSSSSKKKKKNLKNKSLPGQHHGAPAQPGSSSMYSIGRSSGGGGHGVLLLRSKSKRSSVSSPLASPARLARSNSSRKGGELFDAAVRAVQQSVVMGTCKDQDPDTSYEIDLTDYPATAPGPAIDPPLDSAPRPLNQQDHVDQDENHDRDPVAAKEEESEEEDPEEHSDSRINSPTRGSSADADVIAQHRQLAIEVCQALAATSNFSNVAPDRRHRGGQDHHEQDQEEQHFRPAAAVEVCVKKAAALTLKRLDSLGGSDPSPRACLWMRRSIGRPLALDLTRKHRRN